MLKRCIFSRNFLSCSCKWLPWRTILTNIVLQEVIIEGCSFGSAVFLLIAHLGLIHVRVLDSYLRLVHFILSLVSKLSIAGPRHNAFVSMKHVHNLLFTLLSRVEEPIALAGLLRLPLAH